MESFSPSRQRPTRWLFWLLFAVRFECFCRCWCAVVDPNCRLPSYVSVFSPHNILVLGVRNKRLPAIGKFMKVAIEEAFQKEDKLCNVKYIDPSYMIRCGAVRHDMARHACLIASRMPSQEPAFLSSRLTHQTYQPHACATHRSASGAPSLHMQQRFSDMVTSFETVSIVREIGTHLCSADTR